MLLDKEFLELSAENGKLRARIAELEAALRPFAEMPVSDVWPKAKKLVLAARAALGEKDD